MTAAAAAVHGFDARYSQLVDEDTTPTSEFFRNADGSGTALISSVPVRFKGGDGAWRGIDPTLVTDVDGSLRPRSVQALSRIHLDQGEPAVTVSTAAGDVEVRHTGLAADLVRPLLPHPPKGAAAGTIAALAKVANTQASVAVSGGAQVRYDMGAHGFTDDIVLSAASDGAVYRVTMRLPEGVQASQFNNGVMLADSVGNQVATYTGGVAYDAVAAAASPDGMSAPDGTTTPVAITLVSHGAGVAVVRVSIDPAWLADPARVFPVVIDPSFNNGTATSTTGTEDTYVSSDCPACVYVSGGPNQGQAYDALHFLREGNQTGAGTARPMIPFFDVQGYNPPSGWSWTVSSTAQLHLYSTAFASCDLPTDVNVIEKPWNPYTSTWDGLPPVTWSWVQAQNTQNTFLSAVAPDGTQNTTTGVNTWTTFNVTNAIGSKYTGAFGWYGLELQPDPEHWYSTDCAYDWGSADWNHPADTPYLTVNFTYTQSSAPSIGFTDVGNQWAQPPLKDPVNVVTGGLKDSFTDIAAPAGVFGLDWSRTYNLYDAEQNVSAGGLGRGWSSSFFATIAAATDGTGDVTMTGPDGRQVTWTPNPSGGFSRPFQYAADLLVVNGDYRVTFNDGSYWDFDGQGRLAAMTSPDGQQQAVLVWNTSNQLVSVTTGTTGSSPATLGVLSFQYGTNGQIGSVSLAKDSVSPAIESVSYGYDAAGNLHTFTDAAGNVTTYGYDSSNRLATMTDPTGVVQMANTFNSTGQVATQKQPSGATTTFAYGTADSSTWTTSVHDSVTGSAGQATYYWQAPNNNKQVVQIEDNLPNPSGGTGNSATQTFGNSGSDTLGDLTSATSRLGGQNSLTYDSANRVTCAAQPGGACPAPGAALDAGSGPYTAYSYDTFGRIVDKFIDGQGDYVYTYNLDSDRVPDSMTDPTGATTTYTVVDGVVASQTDPDGVVTSFTYDDAGRVLTQTVAGATTSYAYDAAGRQTCVAMPGGTCPDGSGDGGSGGYTFTTYYPGGLVHTQRAADGGVTTYTYDAAGRTLTVVDPTGAVTTNHYDPTTGLLTSTDRPGQVVGGVQQYVTTGYAYDANGNQTCVAAPGGACPNSSGAGGVEPYTLTVYGPLARVMSTTNELGQTTAYKYDADGNKVETDNPDGSVVKAAYDAAGRLYCTTAPGAPGLDNCPDLAGSGASGRYAITRYDSFGRVSCVAQPGGDCVAATGPITTYTYDGAGRQVTVTDVNGGTTTTTYTPGGREKTVTDPDGGVTTYTYDAAGRTSTVENPDGGVTTTTYTPQGWVAATVDPAGLTTSYSYDAAGRQLTATGPDGAVTTRTYTLRGELATQRTGSDGTVSYTYNGDGTVASVTDALGDTTSYTYDARGNRTARTDAQGKSQTWGYDDADELVSQADQLNRTTATTYYDDTTHGHKTTLSDPSGRVTTTSYNPDGTVASAAYTGPAGNLTYNYTYDDLGHTTSASDGTNTWGYASDATGALTSETTPAGATTSWGYDPAGRRTTMTYPDGTQVAYTYYPSGLLQRMQVTPTGGQAQTAASYVYNADGQLTQVSLPDGSRSYNYGTSGSSAGKVVSYTQTLPGATQTTTLAYDANGRLASQTVTAGGGSGGQPQSIAVDGSAGQTSDSTSSTITATGLSTTQPGDLLVALVGFQSDDMGAQSATVSGAGLAWRLAARANAAGGVSEVWTAKAATALSSASVTAAAANPTKGGMLSVVALSGADHVAATTSGAGQSAPSLDLTTTAAGSLILAAGNDYSNATAHTPLTGQNLVNQYQETTTGDDYWAQTTAQPVATAGTTVDVGDSAPTGDLWNLAAVEVVPAGAATPAGIGVDESRQADDASGASALAAPPVDTHQGGETLVALVSTGATQADVTQTVTVSGGGLSWTVAARANSTDGDAEVWTATAPTPLDGVVVQAAVAQPTSGSALTVMSLSGAGGVGATATGGAATGAPTASLTTTTAGSWVLGAGNDWDYPTPRTPATGQTVLHERGSASGDDYWTQAAANPTGPAGSAVTLADTAPTTDEWNLAAAEITPGGGQGGGSTVTTSYGYDDAGQLVSQTTNGTATAYTYDTLGRRATATTAGQTTTYRYDDAGQLCWTSTDPGAGGDDCATPPTSATVYTHDAAGRDLTSQSPDGATTYTYDPAGRLATIHLTDTASGYDTTQTRGYNPGGDLVTLANTGTSTTNAALTWDDATPTPTPLNQTADGATTDLAQGAGQWAVAIADGNLVGVGVDIYGSAVPTDDTPGIAAADAYDAWGNTTDDTSSLEPALGYRGELQTGDLLDLRARDYDTTLGAFTTADPLDGVDGTTTIASPYPYADNNPIANTDPTGKQTADWNNFLTYVNQAREFVNIAPQLSQDLVSTCGSNEPGGGDCLFGDSPAEQMSNCVARAYDAFTGKLQESFYLGQVKNDCTGLVPLPNGLPDLAQPGWLANLVFTALVAIVAPLAEPELAVADIGGEVGTTLADGGAAAAGDGVPQILLNKLTGDAARDLLASQNPGSAIEQALSTPLGIRRVDVLTRTNEAIESKVGRTSLSADVQSQIAKDQWLLANNRLNGVEWVFSRSAVTGNIGPTEQLAEALDKAGIPWTENP